MAYSSLALSWTEPKCIQYTLDCFGPGSRHLLLWSNWRSAVSVFNRSSARWYLLGQKAFQHWHGARTAQHKCFGCLSPVPAVLLRCESLAWHGMAHQWNAARTAIFAHDLCIIHFVWLWHVIDARVVAHSCAVHFDLFFCFSVSQYIEANRNDRGLCWVKSL